MQRFLGFDTGTSTSVPLSGYAQCFGAGFNIKLTPTQALRLLVGSVAKCISNESTPSGNLSCAALNLAVITKLGGGTTIRIYPAFATAYQLGSTGCTAIVPDEENFIMGNEGAETGGMGGGVQLLPVADVFNKSAAGALSVGMGGQYIFEIWELAPDSLRA